jgi:hypothetical protein
VELPVAPYWRHRIRYGYGEYYRPNWATPAGGIGITARDDLQFGRRRGNRRGFSHVGANRDFSVLLVFGSIALFIRRKTVCTLAQLVGTVCSMIVFLIHIFETFDLFSSMGWGLSNSIGHYLDFWSAVLGFTLFPIGYFCYALTP